MSQSEIPTALPYQRDAVFRTEFFNGRSLIAADPGLGKTLIALWLLRRRRIESFPALIVCPAGVKYHWEAEAARLGMRPTVLEGKQGYVSARDVEVPDVTIINYDILQAWLPRLLESKISTVTLDEAQKCAHKSAGWTKCCTKLCRKARHVVALSGTPVLDKPSDLWAILHMVRPDLYPSFHQYAWEFCDPKRTRWGWDYTGSNNLGELHARLTRQLMIRIRKEEVLPYLPKKIRQVVPVTISDQDEYRQASEDFLTWLQSRHADRVPAALRAQQLAKINHLLILCAKLKLRSVVDWCNQFLAEQPGEKLIVFGIHTKMIEALNRRISGKHVIINGSTSAYNRKVAVNQFQTDPSTRVLIGNMQATIGLTLTAASNVAITELSWMPTDHAQAEDRPHRIGTKSTVWVHYLVAHGTIEERLAKIIQTKRQAMSLILDGCSEADSLPIFDQLIQELQGGLLA